MEILDVLTKYAFPLSNELVRHGSSQSSDWFECSWFMDPQIHLLLFSSSPYSPSNTKSNFLRMDGRFMIQWLSIKEW